MIALTAIARCLKCPWTAEGAAAEADKASQKHTKPGHPTAVEARPA